MTNMNEGGNMTNMNEGGNMTKIKNERLFQARLTDVLDAHPHLTMCSEVPHLAETDPCECETLRDQILLWEEESFFKGEVARALFWVLRHTEPIKLYSSRRGDCSTSYGWKHAAEKEEGYISNGSLIAACYMAGYEVEDRKFCPVIGMTAHLRGKELPVKPSFVFYDWLRHDTLALKEATE